MASEDTSARDDIREKTIRTAGHIVKYSREIYHLESVEEVANLTLEATPRFIDGHPSPSVIEIRGDDLTVLASIIPGVDPGDDADPLAEFASETGSVVITADEETEIAYEGDDVTVVEPGQLDGFENDGVTLAAPVLYRDEMGVTGAILVVSWHALDRLEEYHVKPADYLAEHVATAITNIRSRERLERARNDLAKRKEMVEVYDRLLRHDLGNDLQVITGFSDAVETMVEEDQAVEYAGKIFRTAERAAELIDNVGETVKTLQQEGEPEVTELRPVLEQVVDDVETKFESLAVEFDAEAFGYQVYAGDLIDSVVTNIISNAVVHNEGEITVSLYTEEPTPDTVVLGIADDGSGIAAEIREDIFEMGKKGPESDGTGFGLGLARTLVESYGGTIEVRESDAGGADFRVTLQQA